MASLTSGLLALLLLPTPSSFAQKKPSYRELIHAQTKAAPARGNNATVVLVEGSAPNIDGKPVLSYLPRLDHKQFVNINWHADTSAGVSKHSHSVATLFFGQWRSIAKGISDVHVYSARRWLARVEQWDLNPDHISQIFPASIVNHSWVMTLGKPRDAHLLRRVDYSALSNNILHVTGVRRQGAGEALLSGAYNVLSVGGAWTNIDTAYKSIDEFYAHERFRPHLVGPFPHSSAAAPVVAAAAVRLNALATSLAVPIAHTRANSEALPVELLRAILMSSASSSFDFNHKTESRRNQYGAFGLSSNGLDVRFGMGLVNVAAAEAVLRAGVKSPADKKTNSGWRYVKGDSAQATEPLRIDIEGQEGELAASIGWLAEVSIPEQAPRSLNVRLPNFDLRLFDVTEERILVDESTAKNSSSENIRVQLNAKRRYELMIQPKDHTPWPYAVAWHTSVKR